MSIFSIRSNRRQETASVPKYRIKYQNWGIIFVIQLMQRHVLAFRKDSSVYMMTGSFHISLFEGTLHVDKILTINPGNS